MRRPVANIATVVLLRAVAVSVFAELLDPCCALAGAASPAALKADIPAQPLAQALAAFARQTGLQLVYVSDLLRDQRSHAVAAGLDASEALSRLLEGTGMGFEYLTANSVRLFRGKPSRQSANRPTAPGELSEVIVSANRREEAVNRVPIDMTVWTADAMEASGVKGMNELAPLSPGLQFNPTPVLSGAASYLVMRGVAGRNASTTGLYLDDTPIPPVWGDTVLASFPLTYDLDRVEVLRGPQLQLFGEGNQGGAIRFIYRQPSLSTFTALATSELATTEYGAPSYEVGAAVGGPVIPDVLGFRVSAWTRVDGGYVDRVDPFTGAIVESNANRSASTSLRGALTLAPSEIVEITPSLTYTSRKAHDQPYFFTDLSDVDAGQLRNGSLLRAPADEAFYLGALKMTAVLDAADVRAVSSYFERSVYFLEDNTIYWDWGSPLGPGYPVSYADAVADQWHFQQRIFMQELRLASPDPAAQLTWNAAAFYSNYHVGSTEQLTGAEGVPGVAAAPTDLVQEGLGEKTRFAAFAEASLRLTKQLTASIGVHSEHARYDTAMQPAPILPATGADSGLLPRFRLAYQAEEHELLYLTVGKGYGSGGSIAAPFICELRSPAVYGMDTLWSYEIGTKSTLLDGHLQLDSGLFHIAWSNAGYPLGTAADPVPCGLSGTPGAGASNGFDLAVQMLPTARVKLRMELGYTDARNTRTVTEDGVAIVRAGEVVGGEFDFVSVSPWNLTASVDYEVGLGHDAVADLRMEDVFRSQNPGPSVIQDPESPFYTPGYRPDPATNLLNLRASVRWQRYEAALFVNNALNALPIIQQTNEIDVPTQRMNAATFRPRTVGLNVSWRL